MADLNSISLTGRLTRDTELKTTTNGTTITNATIAVNGYKEDDTSFIDLVTFGKTAEILAKYTTKGDKIGITGRIQQRKYEKDGTTRSIVEVVVDNLQLPPKSDKPLTQSQALNGGKDVVPLDIEDKPVSLDSIPF